MACIFYIAFSHAHVHSYTESRSFCQPCSSGTQTHTLTHTDGRATGSNLGFSTLGHADWRSQTSNHQPSDKWTTRSTSFVQYICKNSNLSLSLSKKKRWFSIHPSIHPSKITFQYPWLFIQAVMRYFWPIMGHFRECLFLLATLRCTS